MKQQLAKRKEMIETADNMLYAFTDIYTYHRLCVAEDYIKDFSLVYEGMEGAETLVNIMKGAIGCRREVVRRFDVPQPFDYRYNEEG